MKKLAILIFSVTCVYSNEESKNCKNMIDVHNVNVCKMMNRVFLKNVILNLKWRY